LPGFAVWGQSFIFNYCRKLPVLTLTLQELPAVLIVGEDSPSLIAAAGHMVPGARILDAQMRGHEGVLLPSSKLKIKL
jgi:hypothetical protein